MQVIKEEELTVFVSRWASRASGEAEEDPGKKLNPAMSKEVTQWLSFLSNKLTTPQMSESVEMPPADRLVRPAEFDAVMTAIHIAMSAASCRELKLNRVKGAWLTAFKHAFQDESAELPHVPDASDDELDDSLSLDPVANLSSSPPREPPPAQSPCPRSNSPHHSFNITSTSSSLSSSSSTSSSSSSSSLPHPHQKVFPFPFNKFSSSRYCAFWTS